MFAQSTLASGRGDTSLSCNLNILHILTEHRLTTLHKQAMQCHALGAGQVQALMAPPFSRLRSDERASLLPRGGRSILL
jgi:hypothetical protein